MALGEGYNDGSGVEVYDGEIVGENVEATDAIAGKIANWRALIVMGKIEIIAYVDERSNSAGFRTEGS